MCLSKLFIPIAFLLLISLFLPGCSQLTEKENGLEKFRTGTVVIKITDAPFPAELVAEANITISRISLITKSDKDPEDTDEKDDSAFIVLELEEPVTFNLLELRNGTTAVLAEMELPAGIYKEIRLVIAHSGIVLKSGEEYNLKVPSGASSGLKIKLTPFLEVGSETFSEILLDFDVSKSFVMQGNKNNLIGFIFKPVVRAVANMHLTAAKISGMVTDSEGDRIENATLSLISSEEPVTSAITSEDGYYAMLGILPGEYTLSCQREGFTDQSIDITIEAGKIIEKNFVLSREPE